MTLFYMSQNFLTALEDKPFYTLIQRKYSGKVARRSGVSYMNHIREGAFILHLLYGDDEELIAAYCLHPLFQSDTSLAEMLTEEAEALSHISRQVLILAMEYRRVANSYTIKDKVRSPDTIDIGPLDRVHKMLVADKIQNKKDFLKYMYRKHERASYERVSEHSVQYFDSWLARLGIDDATYQSIVEQVESSGVT